MKDEIIHITEETGDRAGQAGKRISEELSVRGSELQETLGRLAGEARVRKITVKSQSGRTLANIPLVLGVAGVLIVLKPETTGFGWWGTLAVLGTAVAYAISSVLVKILGRTDSTQAMMFWMTGMLAIGATALALPGWQAIAIEHYPILAGIALTGAIGQWGITVAFKHAPAASVAPLEYTGLAWVILIDFAVWSAVPGLRTLMGAALIIASGIYLLRFEARRVPGPA